ncbi:hypothetical protein MVEN_02304700 [Mycena venus]|uniref:Uncharacterized protein n=1 Tax=Mycena venus TaxID=2733690 RepID=A0A8H7CEZ9_9AGAR|nr:hypothetical protein MVEN_02304700 [Mycena venus]
MFSFGSWTNWVHQLLLGSRLDSRYDSRRFDLPLSTWPTRSITLRTPKEVKKLMMAGHIRFKIPKSHIQVTTEKSHDDEEDKSQIEICKPHKDDEDDEDDLPPLI